MIRTYSHEHKDFIIDVLQEENMKLQSTVHQLETAKNNHEQYTQRNNIEIQGISAAVADDHLEHKVIYIFRCLKTNIDPSDVEDCCKLGNSTPRNTIVRFVNFVKKH